MPGQGQIHSAKTGAGFSVAGPVFNSLEPKREPSVFIKVFPSSDVARRKSGRCFTVIHCPRVWRSEFDPPPDNEIGLCLPTLNFFTASQPVGGGMGRGNDVVKRPYRVLAILTVMSPSRFGVASQSLSYIP